MKAQLYRTGAVVEVGKQYRKKYPANYLVVVLAFVFLSIFFGVDALRSFYKRDFILHGKIITQPI